MRAVRSAPSIVGPSSSCGPPPWVGRTRAFLHAGAAQVVATLWPVEDQATAVLMERFYHELAAGAGPAWALGQRSSLAERATARPFCWAGFVAVEHSR